MRFITFAILVLIVVSCNPKDKSKIKSNHGPLCGLFNSSNKILLCLEYTKGTDLNTVDNYCRSERTSFASYGATSYAITEAGTIYCDTDNVEGKCILSDRTVSYYTTGFSPGQGQSDCTSRGGNYQ